MNNYDMIPAGCSMREIYKASIIIEFIDNMYFILRKCRTYDIYSPVPESFIKEILGVDVVSDYDRTHNGVLNRYFFKTEKDRMVFKLKYNYN